MFARVRLSIPLIPDAIRTEDCRLPIVHCLHRPNPPNSTGLKLADTVVRGRLLKDQPNAVILLIVRGLAAKNGRFSKTRWCPALLPVADWRTARVLGRSSRTGDRTIGAHEQSRQSRPSPGSRALGVRQQHMGAKLKTPLESVDSGPKLTNQSRIWIDQASGAGGVGVRPAPAAGGCGQGARGRARHTRRRQHREDRKDVVGRKLECHFESTRSSTKFPGSLAGHCANRRRGRPRYSTASALTEAREGS